MSARHIQALALLVGTIIGVGVFALPFVFSEAGFLLGAAELFGLFFAILLVHLMYGDIALSTEAPHQLPGYAGMHLGNRWRRVAAIVAIFNLLGASIAYIILGSSFTENLIQYAFGSSFGGVGFIIFLLFGFVVFFYDRFFAVEVEAFLTLLLLLTLILLIVLGFRAGDQEALLYANFSKIALPYGVILFALAGTSVIPRVRSVLPGRGSGLGGVIFMGTLIPAVLYLLFAASVISASAPAVSREAISGMLFRLGPQAIGLGSVVGILATITSYIGVGLSFKSVLFNDFKFSREIAWLAAALLPPVLVVAGISDYIKVIGFVGAFMVGIEGIMVIAIWKSLPKRTILRPRWRYFSYALGAMFLLGILYETVIFFT